MRPVDSNPTLHHIQSRGNLPHNIELPPGAIHESPRPNVGGSELGGDGLGLIGDDHPGHEVDNRHEGPRTPIHMGPGPIGALEGYRTRVDHQDPLREEADHNQEGGSFLLPESGPRSKSERHG